MTMKLTNIIENTEKIQKELDVELQDVMTIPFEYGVLQKFNVHSPEYKVTVYFRIKFTSLDERMFTLAYKKLAEFIVEKNYPSDIRLKCEGYWFEPYEHSHIDMDPFISVATKNHIKYNDFPIEDVLRNNFIIGVNIELLPKMEHASEAYDKKLNLAKSIYEFYKDGTLEDGTSYELNNADFYVDTNERKLKSGQEIHYEDLIPRVFTSVKTNISKEQMKELIKLFREYDVDLVIH